MAGDVCQALNAGGQNPAAFAEAAADADNDDNDDADETLSELLAPLLEEWSDVLVKHVLARLDPTDCAMLARVAKPWLAVVLANNLPRAGKGGAVRLKLVNFCGSVTRLAWARDNGCPWAAGTCARVAQSGQLEVMQWAREHGCPWNSWTCQSAAERGHLELLKWARAQGCEWDDGTCEPGGVAVGAGAGLPVG